MNSTRLYHRDIGLPVGPSFWENVEWKLNYSRHALQAALTDRYGLPRQLPKKIQFTRHEVFEVEILPGALAPVQKVCVRLSEDTCDFEGPRRFMDLCLVLVRSEVLGVLTVKTLWFNEAQDKHATLDASKYEPRPA